MQTMSFKSGYVAIWGLPNVGKSTLLNAMLGEKISIVSEKPQTTRERLLGIYHDPKGQILFLDTPGLHHSKKMLNQSMVEAALGTLDDADLILFVVEPFGSPQKDEIEFIQKIEGKQKPYFLLFNKIDRLDKRRLLPKIEAWKQVSHPKETFLISALKKDGLKQVLAKVLDELPEGPAYYPEDQLTDQNLRKVVSERIREKVFQYTHQELPYSVAVVVDEYIEQETPPLDRIAATIYVEKESQKPIVVGKKGALLKRIGQEVRHEIEAFTGRKMFLVLFVKVVKDWTKRESQLKDLGYK